MDRVKDVASRWWGARSVAAAVAVAVVLGLAGRSASGQASDPREPRATTDDDGVRPVDDATLEALVEEAVRLSLGGAAFAENPPPLEEQRAAEARVGAEVSALPPAARVEFARRLAERAAAPRALRIASGVIFHDDFEDGIDREVWVSEFPPMAGVRIDVVDGELRIAGHPEPVDRVAPPFVGLVSRIPATRDVVLRARVRAAGLALAPGLVAADVHLCGSIPDHFVEVMLGQRAEHGPTWFLESHTGRGVTTEEVRLDAPAPDAWREVELLHEPEQRVVTARLRAGDRWFPVGEPVSVHLSTTKVELKARVDPGAGRFDFRFDDMRLYRNPATTPVTLQFISSLFDGVEVAGVECEAQFQVGGSPWVRSVTSDADGRAELFLPREAEFPARLSFKLRMPGQPPVELAIEAPGPLDGAYPGDVWVLCPGLVRR